MTCRNLWFPARRHLFGRSIQWTQRPGEWAVSVSVSASEVGPFGSFRDYVDALKVIGEVQEIDREVDWNLEMGAIILRTTQNKLPAPLFNKVKDAEDGLRALGAPAATSRQRGLYLARLAMMMGMDPHTGGVELVEAYLAAKDRPIQPLTIVSKEEAPCKHNICMGADIDLTRFPVPILHDGDGGRYIQTAGIKGTLQ
jgi:4-hydroxy-3-polyprenylbenzoate decarboxylase